MSTFLIQVLHLVYHKIYSDLMGWKGVRVEEAIDSTCLTCVDDAYT